MIIHLLSVLRVLVENVWAKTQRCVKVNGCFHSLFWSPFFYRFLMFPESLTAVDRFNSAS